MIDPKEPLCCVRVFFCVMYKHFLGIDKFGLTPRPSPTERGACGKGNVTFLIRNS